MDIVAGLAAHIDIPSTVCACLGVAASVALTGRGTTVQCLRLRAYVVVQTSSLLWTRALKYHAPIRLYLPP
jgi:hypothetical protein